MNEKRLQEIKQVLITERDKLIEKVDNLHSLMRATKNEGRDEKFSKEIIPDYSVKYLNQKAIKKDIEKNIQMLVDLSSIILSIEEGHGGAVIIGSMETGEIYPQLKELIEKVGLDSIDECMNRISLR